MAAAHAAHLQALSDHERQRWARGAAVDLNSTPTIVTTIRSGRGSIARIQQAETGSESERYRKDLLGLWCAQTTAKSVESARRWLKADRFAKAAAH